jgi:hypothetical protein
MREPGPPGWESLRWDSKVWLRVLRDPNHCDYTANCRPVLSSERASHRNKTINFRQQHSDRSNIWSQVPQGCSILRHTDWPSVVKLLRLRDTEKGAPMLWTHFVKAQDEASFACVISVHWVVLFPVWKWQLLNPCNICEFSYTVSTWKVIL